MKSLLPKIVIALALLGLLGCQSTNQEAPKASAPQRAAAAVQRLGRTLDPRLKYVGATDALGTKGFDFYLVKPSVAKAQEVPGYRFEVRMLPREPGPGTITMRELSLIADCQNGQVVLIQDETTAPGTADSMARYSGKDFHKPVPGTYEALALQYVCGK